MIQKMEDEKQIVDGLKSSVQNIALNNEVQERDQKNIDTEDSKISKQQLPLFNPSNPSQRTFTNLKIPIKRLLSSIQKKEIICTKRKSPNQNNVTTSLYKCKIPYLTAYNYTYAVHLCTILNKEFDMQGQLLVLPSSDNINKQQVQQQNDAQQQNGYQMVYRFDMYDKDMGQIIMKQQQQQGYKQYQQPLIRLLRCHFTQQTLQQLAMAYNYNQQISVSKTILPSSSLQQHQQHYRPQESQKSIINLQQQKFQFHIQTTNIQQQLIILLYEINMIIGWHLKQYYMYHSFKQCADNFITMVKNTVINYPSFSGEEQQQQQQ